MAEPDPSKMTPEQIAEYQKQNCVFCKIVKGEIPTKTAYEDDKVISILDINPASKGHVLIMPKQHFPIMPVIPGDIAMHMYRITKHLAKALKTAMITNKVTVFIANGAVAGQQSPHFLYHIIPREANDTLTNFNIPANEYSDEEVKQPLADIKKKLEMLMTQYQVNKGVKETPVREPAPARPTDLAQFIDSNPDIKEKIIGNPDGFREDLDASPALKRLFEGINISKLSTALKSINRQK